MTSRDTFYTERDRRTRQYGGQDEALERPVHIAVDPGIAITRAGQIATLALVNLVARTHRRIHLDIPAVALIARSLVPATDLLEAACATAMAITPVLDLTTSTSTTGQALRGGPETISIGLGHQMPDHLHLNLSWVGGCGTVTTRTGADTALRALSGAGGCDPDSVFGAAAAAVLGAAAVFRLAHNLPVRTARFNPVELTADDQAGHRDHVGPIDIGRGLIVGAGAVTSGLVYWARELGVTGAWDIVDADLVELHNTNRGMIMTAAHSGWPDGEPTHPAQNKATISSAAIQGATGYPTWYDHWLPHHDQRYDLVLCLANQRGIRTLTAQRGEPLLLHATTSNDWTAELHRHLPDRDDCPACRLPDSTTPQMACSTSPINPTLHDSPDAALPFLSGAAGLLLAAALSDLSNSAVLRGPTNHWQLDLTLPHPLLRPHQHPTRVGCHHIQPAAVRHAVQTANPGRWDHLDINAHTSSVQAG
jgi:hypothetical protein